LAKDFPIHVLLTGPARGYVKNRLEKAGISFTHHYLKNYLEIVNYYNALDLYIIASRVEGGPKAFLEAWACGVPLVSTKVGMVPDLMTSGENGFITESEDVQTLYERAKELLSDEKLRDRFIKNGLEAVKRNDWNIIARRYKEELYNNLK
jgi:glycosyltransferase involved in cell wall biosynthesis